MTEGRSIYLLIATCWGITILLAVGILLWGWHPALIVIVPIFGFPLVDLAITWLTGDKRPWRRRVQVDRHRRAAGAH